MLSANGLLEDVSVREIFLAVEELTALHEGFATRVDRRVSNWTSSQIVGDVLQSMVRDCPLKKKNYLLLALCLFFLSLFIQFSSPQLVTVYSQFIQFYSNARHAIESCTNSKPSLAKDLEVSESLVRAWQFLWRENFNVVYIEGSLVPRPLLLWVIISLFLGDVFFLVVGFGLF